MGATLTADCALVSGGTGAGTKSGTGADTPEGTLGYRKCAQEAVSTKCRKKLIPPPFVLKRVQVLAHGAKVQKDGVAVFGQAHVKTRGGVYKGRIHLRCVVSAPSNQQMCGRVW